MNYKNIVIVADAGIGDFVFATSALSLIRQCDKNIKIILVTCNKYVELIDNRLNINTIITTNNKYHANKNKFIRLFYKLCWSIKNIKYFYKSDACLILDITLFFTFCAKYMYKIKNIIGPNNYPFGNDILNTSSKYYTQIVKMPKDSDKSSFMMRYQVLVRAIFPTYNLSLPILPNTNLLKYKIINLLNNTKKYKIAISPCGSVSWRVLNIEYTKKLIESINLEIDSTFFILGNSNKEKQYLCDLKNIVSKDIDLRDIVSKTSLLELKEFLNNIDLLISIDTGILHIAANVGIPTISIYGPTLPENSMAISSKNIILCSYRKCSPCTLKAIKENYVCKNPKCITDITVNEIVDKVKEILK